MSDFETVWQDDGPPRISVSRGVVRRGDRSWTQHRVSVQDGRAGVVVVPLAGDDIAFVRLWRPLVDDLRLELVRGFGEGRDPGLDAQRELLEETGLRSSALRHLGTIDLDTGLVPTPLAIFEADVDRDLPLAATDGEALETMWVDRSEVDGLITSGAVRDAISLAALALWRAREGRRGARTRRTRP